MIGTIECSTVSMDVLAHALKNPHAFLHKAVSPNTQLALQVMTKVAFPETSIESQEIFRTLSNLIYYANNYFDIGLVAKTEIFMNNQSKFVALNHVFCETQRQMMQSADELVIAKPSAKSVIGNFILDGTQLFYRRGELNAVTYREIDSAVSALLVFGVINDTDFVEKLGINYSLPCMSTDSLREKYALFQFQDVNFQTESLSKQAKIARGLQAIEMILACQDDQEGKAEDELLGTPNIRKAETNLEKRVNQYKTIAINCGFSPTLLKIIPVLTNTHKFRIKKMGISEAIEMNEIKNWRNIGNIYLLREWLNSHALLSQMMR